MESSKIIFSQRLPTYNYEQSQLKLKINSGLILNDKDHELVIKDCLDNYQFDEFTLDSKVYFYVELKYGKLNIDRLNRVFKTMR